MEDKMEKFCNKTGCKALATLKHIYVLKGDIRLTASSCKEHSDEVSEQLNIEGKEFENDIRR
jgi:hypothetical protein